MGVGEQKVSLLNVLRQGRKEDRKGVLKNDRASRTPHLFVCSSASATGLFLEESRNPATSLHKSVARDSRHAKGHEILQVSIQTGGKVTAT